jgi:serine/threonine protein phosphatase 1
VEHEEMKPTLTENPTFNHGDLVAVGDVHGRFDLLWKLIAKLRDTSIHLLFLGDLIDRAKEKGGDLVVLNIVKSLMEDPAQYGLASVEALRGNHEQMFLDAVDNNRPYSEHLQLWAHNGGAVNSLDEMEPHAEWIRELPLFRRVEDTLFVHAGVRPFVSLEDQVPTDLVWIRNPFLSHGPKGVHGIARVIHGHTPDFENPGTVEITDNRVNLDSGAFFSGVLTGYNHNTGHVFQVR